MGAEDLAAAASVGVEDMFRVPVEVQLQRALGAVWLSVDLTEVLLPVDLMEVQLREGLTEVWLSVDLAEVQLPEDPRGALLPEHPMGLLLLEAVVQQMTGVTFMAPVGTQ